MRGLQDAAETIVANLIKTVCGATTVITVMILGHAAAAGSSLIEPPALVQLKPGSFQYWEAGEFTRDGKLTDAPHLSVRISAPLSIMTHQISVDEYRRCEAEKACPTLIGEQTHADVPAVMVSWHDAHAYAAWLSKKTGANYRLPTDEEWTYAAGHRAPDEAPLGAADAIARWVAQYDRESQGRPIDGLAQPIGHFGANENGLLDVAGNVWEWTDTCYTRSILNTAGQPVGKGTVNCGVRVAEGRHRAYVVDFIRDARAGGCAAGIPPSNLGFRLVRDDKRTWSLFQ